MAEEPLKLLIARYSLKARELEVDRWAVVERLGQIVREQIVPEVQGQLERGYRVSEIEIYDSPDAKSFGVSLSLEYEGKLVSDRKDLARIQTAFAPVLERLSKANDLEGIALFFEGEPVQI